MPKVRAKELSQKYDDFLKNESFCDFILNERSIVNKTLFCKTCKKDIKCVQKCDLEQHISRISHKELSKSVEIDKNITQKEFNCDLAQLCAKANIPFNKVNEPEFKRFIEKYTNFKCPDQSRLRADYLKGIYEQTIEDIKKELKDDYIWLSVDETTDVMGRHITNVCVGPLNANKPNKSYLLNTEFVERANSTQILICITTALSILWPEGIKYGKLLLFLTDAASYMKLTAQKLMENYPKVIHITCLCHGLNNVCDFIANSYPDINKLICGGKAIFRKCDQRKQQFKDLCVGIPLPPIPVRTRWSSWLKAANYYNEYFDYFKDSVLKMDSKGSQSLKELQILLKSETNIKNDLSFISEKYMRITETINELESDDILLSDCLSKVDRLENELKIIDQNYGLSVYEEFRRVVDKNVGFEKIREISDINLWQKF